MKLNKKGLTLIELLGVIVVLGIIALIAFPTVNGIINNTKKDTFAVNAQSLILAAEAKVDHAILVDDFSDMGTDLDTDLTTQTFKLTVATELKDDLDSDFTNKNPLGAGFDETLSGVIVVVNDDGTYLIAMVQLISSDNDYHISIEDKTNGIKISDVGRVEVKNTTKPITFSLT